MGNFVVLQFVWTIHRQQEENCPRESRLVVMGKERRRMIEDLSIVWFDPSSFCFVSFYFCGHSCCLRLARRTQSCEKIFLMAKISLNNHWVLVLRWQRTPPPVIGYGTDISLSSSPHPISNLSPQNYFLSRVSNGFAFLIWCEAFCLWWVEPCA